MPNYFIKIPPNLDKNMADNWRNVDAALKFINSMDTTVNSKTTGLVVAGSKVKVSNGDAEANFLQNKLIAGTGQTITKSVSGGVGGEILTIDGHVPVTLATNHGLSLAGQVLAMGTPSTCTDVTTNSVTTTTHTHEITFPVAEGAEPALGNPGVDGYVLSSLMDGTRSWIAGGSGSSFDTNFYATLSVDQNVTTGADKKVLFDTIIFDGNTEWDVANGYWKCKTTGYYNVNISISMLYTSTGIFSTRLYMNGANIFRGGTRTGINGYYTPDTISIPNMYIAANSYLEMYVRVGGNTTIENDTLCTWFRVTRYK